MLFARNDLDFFKVPPESGGCLTTPGGHRRPVIEGAPVRPWRVECPACEPFLRERLSDLFATTEADLPETPDETKGREDFAKRGATDRDNVLALAMAKLAGVELPQTLRQAISGASPALPAVAGFMVCTNGHDAEPGSRFCSECGAPMRKPVAAACPDGHPVAASAKFCSECGKAAVVKGAAPAIAPPAARVPSRAPAARKAPAKKPLRDLKSEDLKALARSKGLDDSGTRLELIERIRQPKVPAAA